MTSIYQSNQPITRRGVGILCYLHNPDIRFPKDDALEVVHCLVCGKDHPQLYRFFRKPVGLWGHWVVFRINGSEEVPDLSIPLRVIKLPIGSSKLSRDENDKEWHS